MALIWLLVLLCKYNKLLRRQVFHVLLDSGTAIHASLIRADIEIVDTGDCLALGIDRIDRVSKHVVNAQLINVTRADGQSHTWRLGKYPYSTCRIPKLSTSVPEIETLVNDMIRLEKPVVVTVADANYADAIKIWADMVQANKLSCSVVALDENTCNMAESLRCRCFPIYHRKAAGAGGKLKKMFAWKGLRAAAVRDRFRGAVEILKEGRSVIMQDADAIFYPGGLRSVLKFISSAFVHETQASNSVATKPDFIVQNNGDRDKVFDDLNWGFSFMRSSDTTIHLLECLLQNWDHYAFVAPSIKGDRRDTYFLRSQPRINHILELAIARGSNNLVTNWTIPNSQLGKVSRSPTVCTFPRKVLNTGVRHMTGFSDANYKLICARSEGLLKSASDHYLAYDVPPEASPLEQRAALTAALDLAIPMGYKVALPWAYDQHGKEVPFCMLFFFANTERFRGRLSSRMERQDGCAGDAVSIPDLERISGFLSLHTEKHRKYHDPLSSLALQGKGDRICVNFTSLLHDRLRHSKHSADQRKEGEGPYQIRVCNPHEPMYTLEHMCFTDQDYNYEN